MSTTQEHPRSSRSMDSRTQLLETLGLYRSVTPPRYESEFSEEVIQAWREQGVLGGEPPETQFQLDRRDAMPVQWRRNAEQKAVVYDEAGLEGFRRAYAPELSGRVPGEWEERIRAWSGRDYALAASPWNEGFLQVIGIRDAVTFDQALTLLCEQPALAEAQLDHYAGYLEELLHRICPRVEVDYAVFYEPIASNHGPVLSAAMYRRVVLPAMRRIVDCLDRYGVAYRFMWCSGNVRTLMPVWLDAGINGITVNQTVQSGLNYGALRREFGPTLRLFGGVDWRSVMQGPRALDDALQHTVRPVLEQGGYIPHLDDTVRVHMPFDCFRHYRERLDALVGEVFR